jgi:hypothetical protein
VLVYGDQARAADPQAEIAALRDRLAGLDDPGLPIERHARLAALFIAASELAQGLADAAMSKAGGDLRTAEQDLCAELLVRLARMLLASWRGLPDPFAAPGGIGVVSATLDDLAGRPLPASVQLKSAEGYAFYALYPEAYAEAARQLSVGPAAMVMGVRSIGLGLAAVAAAALRAEPPLSVRPVGHPFARHLQLTPALEAELRACIDRAFVVVDEGPGLSGSSFGAVADTLERLGAPRDRISFLPGHGGELGAEASEAHRARWATAKRPSVDFDALALGGAEPARRLAGWFADLTGGQPGRLQDVSGGGWRALRYAREADWPAVDAYQERRKFLLRGRGETWLLKFVGLGAAGERAFDHARRLGEAGVSPPARALRYGFLATPWLAGTTSLQLRPQDRRDFAAHLGRYLGWRADHLPAPEAAGAGLADLREMLRVNAVEALGDPAADAPALDPARWATAPPLRRVWTDNRLHAREWLAAPDGRWLKTDAVDHAAAHDLIGAQDLAWDVAGARVEFDLSEAETGVLLAALSASASVRVELVALLEPAYLAFQLGAFGMASDAHAGWPDEQARLRRTADLYRDRLARSLGIG